MRKKVDKRVRALVEACVRTRHRAFFVIVGDRGREQVVNLHFLLCKLLPKKPSVLWCYKKELGFSSHRKKRQKQLQKKISHGLYDPNLDDPFELFVTSTDIRYCYYKDTQQILGQTFGLCVLQDFEALTPNILCRAIETVHGGGAVCLLLHSLENLTQLHSLAMDIHSRFKTEAFSHVKPRFNERFLLSLVACNRCLLVDDELNVLPVNASNAAHAASLEAGSDEEALLKEMRAQEEKLRDVQSQTTHAPPLDALVKLCVTADQATAVLAFLDCLCSSGGFSQKHSAPVSTASSGQGFQTVSMTSGRGRGKSAALGLAIAAAISLDVSRIYVSAPSPENIQTVFEFARKGLVAVGLVEHRDFSIHTEEVTAETAGRSGSAAVRAGGAASTGLYEHSAVKAVTRIEVFRSHRQTVQYIFPHETDALKQAELLVVDEAASIPLPVVRALLGPYVVMLSSTVNGYEGTGRSLSLKLIEDLRRGGGGAPSGGSSNFKVASRRLREVTLETPIRYASGDCVERWLTELLCLDAGTPSPLDTKEGVPTPSGCSLYLVNRDALFSYHPASEEFLQRLQSLFVSSHYKNSPNDLQLLADAPAHLVFALIPTLRDDASCVPDVYCAIQVAIEGFLSRASVREALGRGHLPSGDLLPWTLSQAFVDEDVGMLSGARIVRIAVHPSLQRMGFGSYALQQLLDFFQSRSVSVENTPAELADLAAGCRKNAGSKDHASSVESRTGTRGIGKDPHGTEGNGVQSDARNLHLGPRETPPLLSPCNRCKPPFQLDYVGASFGLTSQLLRFWSRKNFLPVYLRQTPSALTGEFSCIVVRAFDNGDASSSSTSTVEDQSTENRVAHEGWVTAFAEDFRRRFVELAAGPFRCMHISLALSIASNSCGEAQCTEVELEKLNASNHDLLRLQKYSQQLADLPLITDLIPRLCTLYFGRRMGSFRLSFLQEAALFAFGAQRKSPDVVAAELSVPVNQILALFNKATVKCHQFLHAILEERENAALTASSKRRVAVRQDEFVGEAGEQAPLAEEQRMDATTVVRQEKLQLKTIRQALGKDALQRYAVDHYNQEDIDAVTHGRIKKGSIALKRKHYNVPDSSVKELTAKSAGKKFKNKLF